MLKCICICTYIYIYIRNTRKHTNKNTTPKINKEKTRRSQDGLLFLPPGEGREAESLLVALAALSSEC